MSEPAPAPFTNQTEDNIQEPEPFTNQFEDNIQEPEPFTNQPEDNVQLPKFLANQHLYKAKLQEPLINNSEDNQHKLYVKKEEPPKRRFCLLVCAIFILVVQIAMHFFYRWSDSFSGLFSKPDEKLQEHIDKMREFAIPIFFLPCIMISISANNNKPIITFILITILLLIKIGFFICYFIHLYIDRENNEDRLVALIPEITLDAMIFFNETLKLDDQKNKNKNKK